MASDSFTVKERNRIAQMSLEEILEGLTQTHIPIIARNYRMLLTEIASRLELQPEDVALMTVAAANGQHKTDVRFWGIPTDESIAFFRQLPGRKWTPALKCNTVERPGDNALEDVLQPFRPLYHKAIVLRDGSYRIVDGTREAGAEPSPALYCLHDTPFHVNLLDVVQAFHEKRPDDMPEYIALHGEFDGHFRALVGKGIPTQPDILKQVEFDTRHPYILFRLSVAGGNLRYSMYDTEKGNIEKVLFTDSKATDRLLAEFKDAQRILRHSLFEDMETAKNLLQHPDWKNAP